MKSARKSTLQRMLGDRERQVVLLVGFDEIIRNKLENLLGLPFPKAGSRDPPMEDIRRFGVREKRILDG